MEGEGSEKERENKAKTLESKEEVFSLNEDEM